jgi:hypothetical protein
MTFVSIAYFSESVVVGHPVGAISRTDDKIRSFANLPAGWHYGRGGAVGGDIIRIARRYLWCFLMLGFTETDAFPGAGGEIMVTAYRDGHCIQVTIEVDKTFVVTHEFNGDERYHESSLSGIKASEALAAIATNVEQQCATSFWFTSSTMTTGLVNSLISPSSHQVTGVVLQSFWNNVALTQAGRYVPTSTGFTTVSVENPLFFGASTIPNSLLPAL